MCYFLKLAQKLNVQQYLSLAIYQMANTSVPNSISMMSN